MSLMEMFANPDTFESLTMGERLTGTGITALMGMGITFSILLILWVLIAVMCKVINSTDASSKKAKPEASKAAPRPAATAAADDEELAAVLAAAAAAADDSELVAVLTAAIAAMQGTSASNLVIRKIQRVSGPATVWGSAGIAEAMESRKF